MKAYLAYYLNKDYSRYYIADAENCYKNSSISIAWDEHRPELFDFTVDIKQLNTLVYDGYREIEAVAAEDKNTAITLLKTLVFAKIQRQYDNYKRTLATYECQLNYLKNN